MNIQEYIKKLRALPETQKKVIFFTIMIISALIMGFFAVKSTKNSFTEIGESIKSTDFPKIEITDGRENLPGVAGVADGLDEGAVSDVLQNLDEWQTQNSNIFTSPGIGNQETYINNEYGFEIKYPNDWKIDEINTTDLKLRLLKQDGKEESTIDTEIVSQTRKIKSAEAAIDSIIKKMKDAIKPKEKIDIGNYTGYEAIGTLCTAVCNGSSEDVYSLLSIIYFSNNDEVFYVDYIEGTIGGEYKDNIKDWKHYDEFKNIISTFKSTNN